MNLQTIRILRVCRLELIKLKQNDDKLKEEYWRAIIQECNRVTKSSKMTKKEWLKENNICDATFYIWQKRFRNEIATDLLIENAQEKVRNELVVSNPIKEVEFVELKPSAVSPIPPTSGAVLKFNHASIEIKDDISEELLSKIFKVISHVE